MSESCPLHLTWTFEHSRFNLSRLGCGGASWLLPGSPPKLFEITSNGEALNATNLDCLEVREEPRPDGVCEILARFASAGLAVTYHILLYPDCAVLEAWPVMRAVGDSPVEITRLDSLALPLAGDGLELLSFSGDWGSEFEPVERPLNAPVTLQSRSGRSSKGDHPWFALRNSGDRVLSGAPVWSGNWIIRFEPDAEGCLLSGGLSDWQFARTVQPGEEMEGVHIVLVLGKDLNQTSQQYAAVGRRFWYARSALSSRLPVEWNHWWPYEDVDMNEDVFRRNVEAAARLGMEVCTLDAGWFGPSDPDTFWHEYRGDWDRVNQERFPHGIRALSGFTHDHGMAFGIWCEIEGLGSKAQVALDHPDYPATHSGERLGYVCFGSPAVREWAFQTLSRLITEYSADWIKLDFNVDPGAGCDRADHGHGPGDGLYEHYLGYYQVLERIRAVYPSVVLENCSSGGLRIDLGILRRTDLTFLSDPDWPVHSLQVFWGASTHLAPDRLLHWGYCDWRSTNPPPRQRFDPHDPALTQKQFDYYPRIAMLGAFGYSQKLPDLPSWVQERVAVHTRVYKETVRRFVRAADLYRLTAQPRRSGEGERWCAFQYSLPGGSEHLLFVFRLPGAEPIRSILLQDLEAGRIYTLTGLDGESAIQRSGSDLMEKGLTFDRLLEEDSALLLVQ